MTPDAFLRQWRSAYPHRHERRPSQPEARGYPARIQYWVRPRSGMPM